MATSSIRIALGFVATALSLSAPSLYSQTTYTVFDPESLVSGLNFSGANNLDHYLFNKSTPSDTELYLYVDGALSLIPEKGGLTHLTGGRLNDNDQLLGRGRDSSGVSHDFIYDAKTGDFSVHDFLANDGPYILDFNNLGQVAVGDYTGTQYIHRIYDGNIMYLSPDGGAASGLNNQGNVLLADGQIWNPRAGSFYQATRPSGPGIVFGDNNWVVYSTPTTLLRANLTENGDMSFHEVGQWDYQMFAYGLNSSGVSVGSLWDNTATPWHGFVSFGSGAMWDLNDLVLGLDGRVVTGASSINNRGEIGAVLRDANGNSDFVFLRPTGFVPVPESSTFALGATALALLGIGARTVKRKRASQHTA